MDKKSVELLIYLRPFALEQKIHIRELGHPYILETVNATLDSFVENIMDLQSKYSLKDIKFEGNPNIIPNYSFIKNIVKKEENKEAKD